MTLLDGVPRHAHSQLEGMGEVQLLRATVWSVSNRVVDPRVDHTYSAVSNPNKILLSMIAAKCSSLSLKPLCVGQFRLLPFPSGYPVSLKLLCIGRFRLSHARARAREPCLDN